MQKFRCPECSFNFEIDKVSKSKPACPKCGRKTHQDKRKPIAPPKVCFTTKPAPPPPQVGVKTRAGAAKVLPRANAHAQLYLDVSANNTLIAKSFGALLDPDNGFMFVPHGLDITPFLRWRKDLTAQPKVADKLKIPPNQDKKKKKISTKRPASRA